MKLLGSSVGAINEQGRDIFDRDPLARGLLQLFSNSSDPLVVALDEKWGTGKTVFAKRFATMAEDTGHTAIYFDAFKRDYDPDVFIGLTSELLAKFPDDSLDEKSIKEKAFGVARVLGRVGLKIGFRAITGGFGKLSDISETSEKTEDHNESISSAVVDAEFDKLIDARLSGAKAADAAFQSFRQSLQTLGQSGEGNAKPLIFIIDELDRCRPDYALEVLETIKHFFAVPGVHFLLVCDFGQLLASVLFRYGQGHDSEVYLEKFIDARVSFPVQAASDLQRSISKFVEQAILDMPDDGEKGEQWKAMATFISKFAIHRNYSLRRIERILTQFALCMSFTNTNEFRFFAVVCILCDLKISNRSLFQRAKRGEMNFGEIDDYYKFDKTKHDWHVRWLRYFFDDTINLEDQEWSSMSRDLWRYNLGSPKETALYLTNQIVDRISA